MTSQRRFLLCLLLILLSSLPILWLLCSRSCSRRPSISSLLPPLSSLLPATGWWSSPSTPSTPSIPVRRTLLGGSDDLLITVPPNPDTVKVRIGPDLIPHPADVFSAHHSSFILRRPLVRLRPSLGLTVLANVSTLQPLSYAAGLKFSPLSIGRFSPAGYLCLAQDMSQAEAHRWRPTIGYGLSYRLFGNLAFDAASLYHLEPGIGNLKPAQLFLGISLRVL